IMAVAAGFSLRKIAQAKACGYRKAERRPFGSGMPSGRTALVARPTMAASRGGLGVPYFSHPGVLEMRKVFAVLAVAAVAGLAVAAELKSGPQTGDKLPGPFHPLNVNGDKAGEKQCLVCKNGEHPVAMVFARTADCPQTAQLLKKLDTAT